MVNPTVLAWMILVVFLAMCEHVSVPYSLWDHTQLGGGSASKRLMSALAYGWVERCNDIVGCGTNSFKDKYICANICRLYLLHEI